MKPTNRYLAAFKENFNVVGLTTALSLSLATGTPIPLLIGLVLEAAYLVFVPDLKWYEARLSKLYDADIERRRQELEDKVLPLLRPEMAARFKRLEQMRDDMNAQSGGDESWFREILRKLDYLLEKFLQFASKEVQFREYLESVCEEVARANRGGRNNQKAGGDDVWETDNLIPRRRFSGQAPPSPRAQPKAHPRSRLTPVPAAQPRDEDRWVQETVAQVQAHYDEDLSGLKKLLAEEQDDSTKAVLEKRVDVLQRRREFVGKIGRIQTNLNHQLLLLEDTFGLISDEIRARPPEQVLADIEDVVSQTNTMTQVLEEVAPYEQMLARLSA